MTDFDSSQFDLRRKRFMEELGDGIAVIPGGQEQVRNHDNLHPFRQDSDFYFLTGFPEPDAVAVFNPGHPTERYVLFVRPKDRDREIWDGYRAGVEGAVETFGADVAYPLSELDQKLWQFSVDRDAIYYQLGDDRFDKRVARLLQTSGDQRVRSGWDIPGAIKNPAPIIHELRLIKTQPEVERLTKACEISAAGHIEAMRYALPGLYEYQVQAALEFIFMVNGSQRLGYPSIVGSGPNACILHYHENDRLMEDGDLLLIDAGAEYGYFAADITRTFPVNGQFSAPQRAIYEVVLAAQAAAIELAKPGNTLEQQHAASRRTVASGLVELGLIPGDAETAYAMGYDREFFMHGTGHWLGLDVHDAGRYRVGRKARSLEQGMAFTVEPGVYVDPSRSTVSFVEVEYDEEAARNLAYDLGPEAARSRLKEAREEAPKIEWDIPSEFLGIGVRIEDDILITSDGSTNLTAAVPKEIEDVEALCAEAPAVPRP